MMYVNSKKLEDVITQKYALALRYYFKIPEGRSFPVDITRTGADCSPSAVAAYLGISAREAIKIMPQWDKKNGTTTRTIMNALSSFDKPHKMVNKYYGTKSISKIGSNYPSGLFETEFLKKDGNTFSIGHVSAYDHNIKGELMIYDCNACVAIRGKNNIILQGFWINEQIWSKNILNWAREIFPSKPIKDYHITRVIVPSNNLN